ncbi:hypothetical protein PCL_10246 [Purpureocillium lilacinum]|uniref:Uncharacterized protein n=1 Tax=Purpureocillium lilacinum TaxID=33203 RepID=A0A2U3EFD9_PURLI|nr:hypothetical protein PCL_10246 [Purpureocillium lilacinum]
MNIRASRSYAYSVHSSRDKRPFAHTSLSVPSPPLNPAGRFQGSGAAEGGFAPDGAVTTAAFVMDPNPSPHGWRHPLVAWLGLAQQGRPKFVVFDVSSAISSSALRSPRSISRQL